MDSASLRTSLAPSIPIDQPPRLIVAMVEWLQGFPDCREFAGRKTADYRQIDTPNAFPPLARALGAAIAAALIR